MKKSIYKKPEISLLYFDSEELATASKASYDLGGEGSEHQETGEIIDPGEGDDLVITMQNPSVYGKKIECICRFLKSFF